MKNSKPATAQSTLPVSSIVNKLNDIHDEINVLRKITLFLGQVTTDVAQNYSEDVLEGANFCHDLLNEQFMTTLDNFDHVISEVKSL